MASWVTKKTLDILARIAQINFVNTNCASVQLQAPNGFAVKLKLKFVTVQQPEVAGLNVVSKMRDDSTTVDNLETLLCINILKVNFSQNSVFQTRFF